MEVYWIRHKTHNDKFTQGYIGVSKESVSRWEQHKKRTNKHLTNAFNKYTEDIVFEVLFEDVEEELALLIELEYRPSENIGWNIAKGGGLPPVATGNTHNIGRKHTKETKEKLSKIRQGMNAGFKHGMSKIACIYDYKTNELIAKNVCMSVWCKENGYNKGNLTMTSKADRSKPSSRTNKHHHKGVYLKYEDR